MTLSELKDRIGQHGEIKLTWERLEGWRLVVTSERGTWIGQSGLLGSGVEVDLDDLCERAAKMLGEPTVTQRNEFLRQWS